MYLSTNQLTGTLPPELANLERLEVLDVDSNQLTGEIPGQLGSLAHLTTLDLEFNQIPGTIPPQLGALPELRELRLSGNRLSGTIPPELGNLPKVQMMRLGMNQLGGEIPTTLMNLDDPVTMFDLGFNMLRAGDPALALFLTVKAIGWQFTQTVPPANLIAVATSPTAITLSWSPIVYVSQGHYEISYSTTSGGSYTIHGTTPDKEITTYDVTGLTPGQTYYFVVRGYTPAGFPPAQQNELLSDYSDEVSATTPTG